MLGFVILWQGIDLVSFVLMINRWGLIAEANPVVHTLAAITGVALAMVILVSLKIALMAYLIWLSRVFARRPWLRTGVLTVALSAGVVGGLTNLRNILI